MEGRSYLRIAQIGWSRAKCLVSIAMRTSAFEIGDFEGRHVTSSVNRMLNGCKDDVLTIMSKYDLFEIVFHKHWPRILRYKVRPCSLVAQTFGESVT